MRPIEKANIARRFLRENGVYIFAVHLASYPGRKLRNYMLAVKLGVQRIDVGPRSLIRGLSAMQIGEGFAAGQGLWLEAVMQHNGERFTPHIVIGNNVSLSHWCHIAATNRVEIGDSVLIGSKVLITDHNHGQYGGTGISPVIAPNLRPLGSDRQTIIEKNVWLGDGVVVTAGSRIGEGSVIGANSVVSGQIPRFTIAAGFPAKAIKQYDFETKQWAGVK